MDDTFRDPLVATGFAVVSIDYRLAPETKLATILEDVQDACTWVRDKGSELFQADPGRIAVAGNLAGGYLTLTTGTRVETKPRALVAFWDYGDIIGDWVPSSRRSAPKSKVDCPGRSRFAQGVRFECGDERLV